MIDYYPAFLTLNAAVAKAIANVEFRMCIGNVSNAELDQIRADLQGSLNVASELVKKG